MSEGNVYGITSQGFNPKPIDVIEDESQENAIQMFGNNVDLSSQSPLWKILRVQLVEVNQLWLKNEDSFFNCFIQTSYGSALDLLGEDLGLERKPAHPSDVILTIIKNTTLSVFVPSGSFFQTIEGIIFETIEDLTIPAGDPSTTTGDVLCNAVVAGEVGNIGSHTILNPTNTISGVSSSDNALASSGGTDIETDSVYRNRLLEYVKSVWTAQAIRSAVLGVDGISGVKVIEYATSYDVLVVPQTTFTSELETAVENAIIPVNPITVGFTIIEAEVIEISITGNVVLSSTIELLTANSDATIEIAKYLSSLGIDDDVFKSKIIQSILDVNGIENVYNVVLAGNVKSEKHTYATGTSIYNLKYSNGTDITEVRGIVSGSPHTFIKNTDYTYSATPAKITWLAATLPDNGTEFDVDYPVPPNGIGDIEVNQNSIASIGTITLT